MKPNNEIQTIPSCGNCKKVKELEAEIKKLDELVSWIENKAFEYEDEAYRLRKQLNNVVKVLILSTDAKLFATL